MRLASRSASMPFRRALSACLRQRRAFMPTRSIACGHGWKPQSAELDLLAAIHQDRKSVVSGKSVSVRVDLGGRRIFKKKISNTEILQANITEMLVTY